MTDQLNLTELSALYNNEDAAREKLEQLRWPNGASCPHCESENVYRLTAKSDSKTAGRKGLWKCGNGKCRKQFTVTVNTVFEGSRIPLGKWIMAIYLICSSKKGMSALQLMRMLWPEDGIKKSHYKTAWFMAHRIRYAMSQEPLFSKLQGTVEADESYFGGKLKNMHKEKRQIAKDAGSAFKAPVVTLVERDGRVKTRHMEHVTANNMKTMLQEYVAHPETFLMTDQSPIYKGLRIELIGHEAVDHSQKEYVRDNAHVNTAESVHALLKRGVFGTYHHWSKKHLNRYLAEFDFRWNHRKVSDGERTVAAIRGVGGKRLRYSDPTKVHADEVIPMEKMKDLYLNEKLSLEAIAERLGVSKQAVHGRLVTAKVKFRTRGFEPTIIDKDILVDLYITKQLTRYRVGKELGIDSRRLNAMLRHHGITLRKGRPEQRRHPELADLKVGEALTINVESLRKNYHVGFYHMAKRLGIRVSVKRVDGQTARVTRVG